MNKQIHTILEKINVLNQAILDSMLGESYMTIIKNFTEVSIEILEADFGFASWKLHDNEEYKVAYKSLNFPINIIFPEKQDISPKEWKLFFNRNTNIKSHLNIPVHYGDHVYGNIIICYKNNHTVTEEELMLSNVIGNVAAQAITIPWLIENEEKALSLAEKQKEIEVLLEQEKLKTEFTANATHELRTPLAIMKGNVDLAMGKPSLKSSQSALQAINIEINILSEILKDLVLLTASGKHEKRVMSPTPLNIVSLITKAVKRLRITAAKQNISIKIKNKKGQDLFIAGDEEYLEKLFLNLIKNAIAYGKDNGSIVIDLSRERNTAKIQITDNGIGISKEDLPKIFDRFYRADKAHNSYGNHSGLGLAIVRWITELHGGHISVKSVYGKGSTFTVSLPILKKHSKYK